MLGTGTCAPRVAAPYLLPFQTAVSSAAHDGGSTSCMESRCCPPTLLGKDERARGQ